MACLVILPNKAITDSLSAWAIFTPKKGFSTIYVFVATVEIIAISVGEIFYLFNWNPACEQATDGPK